MRDVLITVVIVGFLPFILRSPRVGVYVWAWLAMMIPYRAAYGFARTLPFAQVVAITTLISFVFSKERRPFPVNSITVTYILFIVWMSVTAQFAINTPEIVMDRWVMVLKIHLMIFVTLMLLRGRDQIERMVWIVTLSVGFYGIKGGAWTILTGGGGRVWGPTGGVIEGNNELGLALVMLIPFMYFLLQISRNKWLRRAMIASMVLCSFSVLGSQSRGALLALVAMSLFLGLKGRRPVLTTLLIGTMIGIALVFMPDTWSSRMGTIQTYEQDGSAMSRIYTWRTLWAVALDRPLIGAGFATDSVALFMKYAPPDLFGLFPNNSVFVAHSIYLQALGEHGFPGLALYVLLGVFTWITASRIARETRDDPEYGPWAPLLMRMVQVSLIGFAVGGAFLTLVHFDMPYYIISYVVLVDASLRERAKERARLVVPPSALSPPKPST